MPADPKPVDRKELADTFDRLGALISEMWQELVDLRRKYRAERDSVVQVNLGRRRDDPAPPGDRDG